MAGNEMLEGGCMCGAVRYRLKAPPQYSAHCHCTMCRRAGGAPMVTWATMREADFEITAGAPRWYHSSDHGRRAFCSVCGTPLFFTSTHYPGYVDVTVGSLDHPERITPIRHIYEPDRIPWLVMSDGLPRHVGDSHSPRL